MFCPNCNAYLQEHHLIKKNVKKFDSAIIEYDARCPACNEEIGHMFWGVFTPAQHLQAKEDPPLAPQDPQDAPSPPLSPQQNATGTGEVHLSWPQAPESEACTCPHCGKPLPKEYQKVDPGDKA